MLQKRPIAKISLLVTLGTIFLALAGTALFNPRAKNWLERQWHQATFTDDRVPQEDLTRPSTVLSLASLTPEARQAQLETIAAQEKLSFERNRARYLLASDLIQKYEGGPALLQLEGLELEYPVMAPYILLKRGRAYELTNENAKALETWQQLVETHPDSPVVAEALYQLGRSNPEYWEQAIARFPKHPRTQEIARSHLKENPKQPQLLLLLAKNAPTTEGSNQIRDRLVKEYASQLSEADWDAIAAGYWQVNDYKKAIEAYRKIRRTPENTYRIARGLQLTDKSKEAKSAYQYLIRTFPDAEETGLALQRLVALSKSKEALPYLDLLIAKFPDRAPAALLQKADILDNLGSRKSAAQARQTVLKQYAASDAAAEYRWKNAQKLAAAGNLVKAWEWAQPITTNNPDSSLAPKAAFWIGKWAMQLGRQQDAKDSFEHILRRHPQSYYAWRSAVLLGWQVGDFDNVRYIAPTVVKPSLRPIPPSGSDIFKELYRLGQDGDALTLFQAEIVNPEELTVAEQFTDGLLKLTQGKILQGINGILFLQNREDPQDRSEWQALRKTPAYWQALFPFPYYQSILDWAGKRQLNPLLVTSLIRQESRFEPEIRSPVGATGLMQVMPETGEWVADKIALEEYSLTNPNDNLNLGTWYLDYTHQEYSNNSLLAVASYNAGPGNVTKWMREYNVSDPDVFVEKIPFPETKGYVESVFSNYWNYLRIYNPNIAQQLSRYTGTKLVTYSPQ